MEFLDKLSSLGFHLKWKFAKTLGERIFQKGKENKKAGWTKGDKEQERPPKSHEEGRMDSKERNVGCQQRG